MIPFHVIDFLIIFKYEKSIRRYKNKDIIIMLYVINFKYGIYC